jgi:exosortase/archaeosortase family protein
VASTIPIAILCNIVRVVVTAFIYVLWDPRYAQGIYHDMLGMAMLPLAFGLYGALAWLMSNLFVDETVQEEVIIRRKDSQ